MAQIVACPECKKPLQVPDELLGKKVQCPECKHTFAAKLDSDEDGKSTATTTTPSSSGPSKPPAWEKKSVTTKDSTPPRKKRRNDDEDDDDDDDGDRESRRRRRSSDSGRRYYAPHRGGMILAFGILGLLAGPIFAILAWILGNSDLQEMREGRMDPTGEGMTQTGRILGIVGTLLWIVGMIVFFGIFGLFCFGLVLAVGNAGGPNGPPRQRR